MFSPMVVLCRLMMQARPCQARPVIDYRYDWTGLSGIGWPELVVLYLLTYLLTYCNKASFLFHTCGDNYSISSYFVTKVHSANAKTRTPAMLFRARLPRTGQQQQVYSSQPVSPSPGRSQSQNLREQSMLPIRRHNVFYGHHNWIFHIRAVITCNYTYNRVQFAMLLSGVRPMMVPIDCGGGNQFLEVWHVVEWKSGTQIRSIRIDGISSVRSLILPPTSASYSISVSIYKSARRVPAAKG